MIVLVPGYGTGLNAKVLPNRKHNGGFFIYDQILAEKKAVVFDWAVSIDLNWWQSLSVPLFVEYYWNDRRRVHQENLPQKLSQFLHQHQPDTIVAHSLGTEILWESIEQHGLPSSVKKIVFAQSDLPHHIDGSPALAKKIARKEIELINIFSPADPNLMLSSFLHRQARAGLLGLDLAGCHNILLPWLGNLNIHSSPLGHPWLLKVVSGEIT